MSYRMILAVCLGFVFASTQAQAVDEYRLDDGVGEQNIGVIGGSANKATAWLNRFVIEPGKDTITDISVAFGDIPVNNLVEVILWGDFNNDGNPIDAFVLSATPGMITNPNVLTTHNVFQTFDIPDVMLPIGAVFYAGAVVQNYAQGKEPARIDKDGTDSIPSYLPNGHSFIASQTAAGFATVDPNNLAGAQLPIVPVATALGSDGTWLIRVNAVPEPATAGVMLVIGAVMLRRRGG